MPGYTSYTTLQRSSPAANSDNIVNYVYVDLNGRAPLSEKWRRVKMP